MLKKIRNITLLISAVFCWGIVGSLELSRLTLTDAVRYMITAIAVCTAVYALEAAARFTKKLIVRYARTRARSRIPNAHNCRTVHRAAIKV